MSDLLIVTGAVVLVILSTPWWPAIRNHMRIDPRPAPHMPGSPAYPPGSPLYDPDEEFCEDCQTLCTDDRPCVCCYVEGQERQDPDSDWVDELHHINQLGKFGDLTRPAKDLTHYEVEAVIRQLGVPEWVPPGLRVAA